jgi:hypothetical protein
MQAKARVSTELKENCTKIPPLLKIAKRPKVEYINPNMESIPISNMPDRKIL